MFLFRIHIRPGGGNASIPVTFDYCLRNKILGVGWRITSLRSTKDWNEYYELASKEYNDVNVCKYMYEWITEGDLIWTRDLNSQYYLARVTSGWEYWSTDESIKSDIDIANIVRCDKLRKIEIDRVPGKVKACFRAPRTIQEIVDKGTLEYSKFLWNQVTRSETYMIDKTMFPDIFAMIDDEETEDLIFLYLQSTGWFVVPNSRKRDTMAFEYLVIDPKTGMRAQVQVKTGNTALDPSIYSKLPHKVFLFQAKEIYQGPQPINVICIRRQEIEAFLSSAASWLPKVYTDKMRILSTKTASV
jgi:hypothetical protein